MSPHPEALEGIGPCRLVHEIGAGSMGTVYLAEMREDRPYASRGTRVAVKVLKSPRADAGALSPALRSARDRFAREATLGSSIDHPAVVRTYEAGFARSESLGED